jgi:hydroxyacid-oxoacid transhydrogenase
MHIVTLTSISCAQMACSTIQYGPGITQEVGMDLVNMKVKNVCVMTDPYIAKLPPLKIVLDSLTREGVKFEVYDQDPS